MIGFITWRTSIRFSSLCLHILIHIQLYIAVVWCQFGLRGKLVVDDKALEDERCNEATWNQAMCRLAELVFGGKCHRKCTKAV